MVRASFGSGEPDAARPCWTQPASAAASATMHTVVPAPLQLVSRLLVKIMRPRLPENQAA
jgi:hypothetical protein